MANSKFERNRSKLELILGAEEKFWRSDQKMTILYRLHNLPHRRVDSAKKYVDQDFVLNLAIGDRYILAQDLEEDHRSGESCYFGELGSIVDKAEEDDDNLTDAVALHLSSFAAAYKDLSYMEQRLFGDYYSKYLDPKGHCQVGRDKSSFWIKDLGSKCGTFVNGIKLKARICHVLKSGDLISLGFIYEEEKPWMLEMGHYWIFKFYEVPQSEFEHRNAVASEAMEISVIVDTIFSNLGFQDLKSYRTVSPVWDEAAKRALKPLASVDFNLYDPKMDNNRFERWSQRWWFEEAQNKLSTLQSIGIRSISLNENNSSFDFPTERLVFLQNMIRINNQITSVECDFLANTENAITLFKNILSSPQLSEVTFTSRLFLKTYEEEFIANESVRKLIFKKSQFQISKILQLFPNTREIELVSTEVAHNFLNKKYEDELKHVKVLKIFNNKMIEPVVFQDYERQSIKEQSSLIFALPNSLQLVRLEITDLYDTEEGGSGQQLFNLLSKFKNSLQHLKLGLSLHRFSHLKFPEMKMLNVFKLDFQREPISGLPSLVSGFGSELFPRLEMLEVVFGKFSENLPEKFVKINFGCVSGFKNVSVRQLRFLFPDEEMKEEFSQMAEGNFREFFPNCVTFNFGCN